MRASYSADLRRKIFEAVSTGTPRAQVAFGVGLSTVERYTGRAERGEGLDPRKPPAKGRRVDGAARRLLERGPDERPTATLPDRRELLVRVAGVEVSDSTVSRVLLRRMGIGRKEDRRGRRSATGPWGPLRGPWSVVKPGSTRDASCSWTSAAPTPRFRRCTRGPGEGRGRPRGCRAKGTVRELVEEQGCGLLCLGRRQSKRTSNTKRLTRNASQATTGNTKLSSTARPTAIRPKTTLTAIERAKNRSHKPRILLAAPSRALPYE